LRAATMEASPSKSAFRWVVMRSMRGILAGPAGGGKRIVGYLPFATLPRMISPDCSPLSMGCCL